MAFQETSQIPESSQWHLDNDDDDDSFGGYNPLEDIVSQHPEDEIHVSKNPDDVQQLPKPVQSYQKSRIPCSSSSSSYSEISSANSLLSSSKKKKTPAKKKGKKVKWASNVKKASSSESSGSAAEKVPPKLEPKPEPLPPPAPVEPEPVKTPTPEPAVAGNKWPIPYIAFGCVVTIFIVVIYVIFVARTRTKSKQKSSGPPDDDEMQAHIVASAQDPLYPDPPSYASVTASESSFPVYIPSPAVSVAADEKQ